jgi:hypothetical protein
MSRRRSDLHALVGPYALDALSDRDRQRFDRHLSGCGACRDETRGLMEASARLAVLTAAAPPAGLRGRVLTAAATTRQLPPPVPAGADPDGELQGGRARRAALSPVLVPRLAVAVGGGFILLALAFGSLMVNSQHRLGLEQARSRQIAVVMNAPDATMMTGAATGGGTATVVMSHRDRSLVLTTAKLPALPDDKGYQLWLKGPAGMRAAGMLPAPHQGMTPPVIVSGLGAKDQVVLTVEPVPGTRHPTSRPVLLLILP